MLFPYTPTKDDELVLSDGDYVYVHASDSGHTGTHHDMTILLLLSTVRFLSPFLLFLFLQRMKGGSLAPLTTQAVLVSILATTWRR